MSHPPTLSSPPPRRGRRTLRRWLTTALTLLLAVTGLAALAGSAAAAPVYKIAGEWVNAPATISRGNPVVAEWRINVNDDQPAPSNDPVENVTATFSVEKAFFDGIPDMCLTTGVTPASSLNAEGTELTCNFGTVDMGTALVLQTPVIANGITGDQIVLDGTSPSGENVELPPVAIQNPFRMDMQWGGVSNYAAWDDVNTPTYAEVDLEWSLRLGNGSDPGPNTVTQRLTLTSSTGAPVQIGFHPSDVGQTDNWGVRGCTEFDMDQADGHPYSHVPGNPRSTSFVESCTLTAVAGQPGVFDLTLTGINYDLLNVPELDSFGNPLPTDWDYVASGMVWFRVLTNQGGSVSLSANTPTYTAPTGQTSTDLAGNNTSSKAYTLPGSFSSSFDRGRAGSGGTRWDDSYRASAGSRTWGFTTNWLVPLDDPAPAAQYGNCDVVDPAYLDFDATTPILTLHTTSEGRNVFFTDEDRPGVIEYHTGGVGDPNTFNCATGAWSATLPADPTTVTAVRWRYPASAVTDLDSRGFTFIVPKTIENDVAAGQDVWHFGSYLRNGTWVTPADNPAGAVTPTPDYRYPYTNGRRDVLVVVAAIPAIRKAAAQNTVTPGVPAQFTLTYAANGAGNIPPEVDGYVIRDVLPQGMTYVTGSASPEPVVTTNGSGQQVLTWTLNDVTTNTQHPLVYEAVTDPLVAPGTALTNTAVSTLGGEESAPATKTVTTTTNGYTVISKTADTPYIPNLDGSGDGEGTWSVTLRSFDPLPQAFTDTIDVLPYEGDARGTDFEGDYSLVAVEPVAGSTVYYTTADPASLNDDPADASNGAAPGNPTGNTAGWTTEFTPDATAVRVVGPALAPGGTQQFKVRIATDGADPRDVYVNRAQARTGHTRLEMRTSEPMSVAYYYAATLKKYVQDTKGVWRDAQDVADYPTFRYGDTVRYRIVVTNVGQGTLNNIRVTDDQQPDLGNFVVEELAAGESESHEFEFVLDESTNGTVVNTASATTDPPPDSPPPTIPPDPAGFEVANYKTVKSSTPKPGTVVFPGKVIRYNITVTQQGTAPAEAEFTDNLARILDDATYNRDVRASIGDVEYRSGRIFWTGTIPVGGVARITYTVRVKAQADLGNRALANVVTSPGCAVRAGQTVNCDTSHRVGKVDLRIDKRVVGASRVQVGENIRYRLQVTNRGPDKALAPIRVVDKLPRGLELVAAAGSGWTCKVQKSTDIATCVRNAPILAGRKAPAITLIAKTTRQALGRRLVNVARVNGPGDTVPGNNVDVAGVRVVRTPPPNTGFRPMTRAEKLRIEMQR